MIVSGWAKAKNDRNLFTGRFHSEEAANNWFDLPEKLVLTSDKVEPVGSMKSFG
jgi:hypothetical protein